MSKVSVKFGILFLVSIIALSSPAFSQDQTNPTPGAASEATTATPYSQAQLSQMLAPIALYPDPLISQILMASTYPLEIVEASRWLQTSNNTSLQGDQLAQALEQQPWDPSVKALVPFPQVLHMMDQNIQWTEQLGDAFLAQQSSVMDSIQKLRQEAQTNGTLGSSAQQSVSSDGSDIIIEPTNPNIVYVPAYDPGVVYGSWPYEGYPPYSFYPAGYYFGPGYFGFGVGIGVVGALWGWDHWDWYHHRIDIDNNRFAYLNHGQQPLTPGVWQHNPAHRLGVPYRNAGVRAHFQSGNTLEARRNYRGYAPSPSVPTQHSQISYPMGDKIGAATAHGALGISRPSSFHGQAPGSERSGVVPSTQSRSYGASAHSVARPMVSASLPRPSTPLFESFARGPDVRSQALRGAQSRAAAPQVQHAPAPSGGHSGGGGREPRNER